ncbi:Uncharacterised protein [Candidatus Anstonella stagnisolia]|nr:Uncharacterised protein [Candidatus Anstonella stagnisolia]
MNNKNPKRLMSITLMALSIVLFIMGAGMASLSTKYEDRMVGLGMIGAAALSYAEGAFIWSGAIKDDLNEVQIRKLNTDLDNIKKR